MARVHNLDIGPKLLPKNAQAFNRRHRKMGHLFQGRFKAILVDRDAYLLEVCRYVELKPVRARMVSGPGE
jgi:hypothetical protein